MLLMTNPQASMTQEVAFGRAVAFWRGRRDLSQKQLAEKLTSQGMKADASAVSRIESGARSVRLVEAMLIADVLNLDLDAFTRFALTPAQQLHRLRRAADAAMQELESPLQRWLDGLADVKGFLDEHPHLVSNLPDSDGELRPDAPDEYFDWVQRRVERMSVSKLTAEELDTRLETEWIAVVPDVATRDELVAIAAEYAKAQILVDERRFRRNSEVV